jgi:uncharacterized RDD family membrane protein YckC
MPVGQKICDMCGGPPATAAAKWQAPLEAAPVQLASSAAGWSQPQAPPPQAADHGIAVPSYVTVGSLRAPFWMRAIALLIDGAVVGIPSYALSVVVLQQPAVGPRYGIGVLLNLIYFVYFWSGPEKGQTLGMSLFNLHVVKIDGSYLDVSRAFIRYLGFFISQSVFGLGLLWAAFDANKQGWHDKIAGTYVIRAAS